MFDASSRYAALAIKSLAGPDGRTISYVERRILPQAASLVLIGRAAPVPGERSDLFAARTLGDPALFWRVADANAAMDPDTVMEGGGTLAVPLPTG